MAPRAGRRLRLPAAVPAACSPLVPAGPQPKRRLTKKTQADKATKSAERQLKLGRILPRALAAEGGTSLLESVTLLDSVREDYRARGRLFLDHLNRMSVAPDTGRTLLLHLVDYLDAMFLSGCSHADGTKVFVALRFCIRTVERKLDLMERVRKALSEGAKRAPEGVQDPRVWEEVMAMADHLLYHKHVVPALALLTQLVLYLRPGEFRQVKVAGPPSNPSSSWSVPLHSLEHSATASKTGERDEALTVDHPKLGWIGRLLGQLRDARTGAEFLWPFIQDQYSAVVMQAAADLKLMNFAPYSLRHAGASSDLLFKYRTAADVKLCGRWKGDSFAATASLPRRFRLATVLCPRSSATATGWAPT